MTENKIVQWLKKNMVLTSVVAVIVVAIATPIGVYSYNSSQYNKLITLGDKALESEKFDDAEKYYTEALNHGKKKSDDINKKLASIGTAREAKEIYNEGLKLLGDKNYLEAIEAFKKINSIEKYKIEAQNKIVEASSAFINESLIKAREEGSNKKYSDAIAILDAILKFDEANKDALSLKEEYNKELTKIVADKKEQDEKTTTANQNSITTSVAQTNNSNSNSNTNTNPSATISYGNTTGNIINGGITTFDGEFIYFTNNKDGNKIYKVRPDNSGLAKVSNSEGFQINVVGEWVYYSSGLTNPGIFKVKKDGSNATKISSDLPMSINVVGEWIYYSVSARGEGNIYKIKVDGSGKTRIPLVSDNYTIMDDFDFVVVGDWIYANLFSKNDGATVLCRIKIDGSTGNKLMDSSSHHFVVNNGWIYYVSGNYSEINKMKTDGSSKATVYKVSNFGVYSLNVTGNYIFFSADNQTASQENGGIYRINMDGSGFTRLSNIYCKHFSVSSNWIYYDSGIEIRRVKIDGTQEGVI